MFLVFTGQGSQFVGMGKSFAKFPEMKLTMEEMDDALSLPLSRLILDGDDADLVITENAQPAIACISVGIFRILKARFDFTIDMLAGHSAGEYSALTVAESISWPDAVKTLQIRGRAMQEACPVGYGGMAAILGMSYKQVDEILKNAGLECYLANDNGGQQIVISGEKSALSHAVRLLKAAGALRTIELSVSAPFHTPLIKNAEIALSKALNSINISDPKFSVISNVTAEPYRDAKEVKKLLIQQITSVVRWSDTVGFAAGKGTTSCVELGPAPVLSKLVRRIASHMEAISICCEEDLKKFEQHLMSIEAQR